MRLRSLDLFSSLSASALRAIEDRARLVEFKKGDLVYQQGDQPDAFYVILSGRFRVFLRQQADEEGKRPPIFIVGSILAKFRS